MSRWSSSSSSPWTLPPALPEGQGTPHRQNINNRGKNHPDALAELGRRADRAHHLSADIFFLPQSPVSTTLTAPAASRHALPTRHHFFAIHISPPPVQDYLSGATSRIVSCQPHTILTMLSQCLPSSGWRAPLQPPSLAVPLPNVQGS